MNLKSNASAWFSAALIVMSFNIAQADEITASEAVEKARKVLGIADFEMQSQSVMLIGQSDAFGLSAQERLTMDPTGRFIQTNDGEIPRADAFDGKTVRNRDMGGEVTDQILGDRVNILFEARAITGMWLAREFSSQFHRETDADTKKSIAVAMHLDDGRAKVRGLIDRDTWRPRRWSLLIPGQETRIDLKGAIQAGPLILPEKISATSNQGETVQTSYSSAELVSNPDWALVLSELKPPDDADFSAELPAGIECKRTQSGHILVRPKVNEKESGWFIFDTGAGQNVMDKRAVKGAGLKTFGHVTAVGIGGSAQVPFCRPDSFQLGPVTIRSPLLIVLDLAFLDMALGERICGIVGYGLLARCVVEFDQSAPEISLHDPAAYKLTRGEWSPLSIYHRVPCVPGVFENHKGLFRLDTGASGWPAAFHSPTTRRLGLLTGRNAKRTMVGGVGGMKAAKYGTMKTLQFGGQSFDNQSVAFYTADEGAFADPYIDANIGEALIGRSVVIFNYPRQLIAFLPKLKKSR